MPFLPLNAPEGPIWVFFVVALMICLAPWLVERVRLPGMLGLLAAGFVIGPHGLGIVDADDRIIPALGQLGLLYLMFIAGAELDFDVIRQNRGAVFGFTLLTFSVPMVLGVGVAVVFGFGLAAALLIGSLWSSHTLLAYPTVRNAGLVAHPAVATTVGATVGTDTLSLAVLAAVAGSATGSLSGVVLIVAILLGLAVLAVWCIVILPRVGQFFYTHIGFHPTIRYAFVLMALLSAAVLAEVVGVEAIVGAFFAGLGLNRLLPTQGRIFERIEFIGAALLIPLFLLSVGLIVDPAVMLEPSTLALAAGFMVASFGGKALAALGCRPLFGYSWPDVGITFALTTASAAATLAATFVGFEVGLIGTTVVNAVVVVIVFSVVLSSVSADFFVRRLRHTGPAATKLGRAIALVFSDPASAVSAIDFAARVARVDDGVVLPRVVVVGDGSIDETQEVVRLEHLIARRGLDCETHVRHGRSLGDMVAHISQDDHASSVVVSGPVLQSGAAVDGVRELAGVCPVPIFVISAPSPIASLRIADDVSANGRADEVVGRLAGAGIQLEDGMTDRRAGLARFFRSPTSTRSVDGVVVIAGPATRWTVTSDTIMVVLVPSNGGS
jgi:Kef-type K+ transport system membrane component KefB